MEQNANALTNLKHSNKKSSAVKRILSEAKEFKEADTEYTAHPLEENLFEWHFTLRGPSSSEFQEGIYHGRILLPIEYPFRPPDVMLMTPNGRWELNKKICLTFTGFHEEMWQPAWGIRTALIGVQAFMGARAEAAVGVGSLDYPEEEREKLAKKSRDWMCPVCQVKNSEILSNEATRKIEQLPDGLTVDPSGGKGKVEENAEQSSSSKPASFQSSPVSPPSLDSEDNHHCFGASGPPDALLASIGDDQARLSNSFLNDSTTTSCVTSGPATPTGDPPLLAKGKQSEVLSESPSSSSTSTTVMASESTLTSHTSGTLHQASPLLPALRVNQAHAAIVHQQSTAEPERRLAVLDRAIFTVIFLLLALVLRRVLNAVT